MDSCSLVIPRNVFRAKTDFQKKDFYEKSQIFPSLAPVSIVRALNTNGKDFPFASELLASTRKFLPLPSTLSIYFLTTTEAV
jgi:hypothetical protein